MDIIQKLALAFFGVLLGFFFFGTMAWTVLAQHPEMQASAPAYFAVAIAVPVVIVVMAVAAFRSKNSL